MTNPFQAVDRSKPAAPKPAERPEREQVEPEQTRPAPAPQQEPQEPQAGPEPENGDGRLPSRRKLNRMREAELQALADERGVGYDPDGTRAALIDALEADAGREVS